MSEYMSLKELNIKNKSLESDSPSVMVIVMVIILKYNILILYDSTFEQTIN